MRLARILTRTVPIGALDPSNVYRWWGSAKTLDPPNISRIASRFLHQKLHHRVARMDNAILNESILFCCVSFETIEVFVQTRSELFG